MKIVRAEFTNFRILRDLVLDFPTDEQRKLVVIRAENESGKTTILNALQWGFFGDDSLPGGGRSSYRLHPIDWDLAAGERVPITVEIDFQKKSIRRSRTYGRVESVHTFRIIRQTYDVVNGAEWQPGPSTVQLFEMGETGSEPIEPPEAWIKEEIPAELREIFFTDGDRALSFIEADVTASTKQQRVRRAIEALLGLDVIQDARDRVKKTASSINKRARGSDPNDQLARTVSELAANDEALGNLEESIREASGQFEAFDERFAAIEKKIEETLAKGNRDDLNRERRRTLKEIERRREEMKEAARSHSGMFRELSLAAELLSPLMDYSLGRLDELRDQGKIPNSTIPVLRERLQARTCICGESLEDETAEARLRREHIEGLIQDSEKADALQGAVTSLYFASRALQVDASEGASRWVDRYQRIADRRDRLERERNDLGAELRGVEARIAEVPNTDLADLREARRNYMDQRDRFNNLRTRHQADRKNLEVRQSELRRTREALLRQQEKGYRILDELAVAQDIENVLTNAYRRLTHEELDKVSTRMNEIFLEMIGSDPSQGAIIQYAEITRRFEIRVYGVENRQLNPDRDLNGASRRALTMAFILALARVSEVEAPNVIDTPLGMMSGYVKNAVLNTAIRESSQLVLFLTRSEIAGCEEIIDAEAAQVMTLTNPAHYPVMLVNEPEDKGRAVVRCGCSHRGECRTCARRTK